MSQRSNGFGAGGAFIGALASILLVASALTGCSDDASNGSPVDSPDAVSPDGSTQCPDFEVTIVASATTGNAPLEVDFSVEVAGVDAAALRYRWLVDGILSSEEAAFTFPFYRATSYDVTLEAEFRGATCASRVESDSAVIRVQGCADLVFDTVSLEPPTEVAPGELMTLKRATLSNEGDRIENSFDVLVALSADDRYDADGDLTVERWTVDGMPSGLVAEATVDYAQRTLTVPGETPEGNYFVFLVADPDNVVNECQENNNLSASTNNLTVEADAGLRPDITISDVTIAAGSSVTQGQQINYSFTVANIGQGETGQFRNGFWLSTDHELDPDFDVVVASPNDEGSKLQGLQPGAELSIFKSYQIPDDLPDGEYFLIGQVDVNHQVSELDETNNVAVSEQALTMEFQESSCFDLTFADIQVAPLSTYWDGSVQLTATILNEGSLPTPDDWLMRGFLSQQATLNPATARVVGDWRLGAVPAGETRTFDVIVPISNELPVLPHYVGAIVDPDDELEECVEANNARLFAEAVTISATASVDVAVSPVQYHPTRVDAGSVIKLAYELSNTGSSGATAMRVAVVLSEDGTITRAGALAGQDLIIASLPVSSVPAGGVLEMVTDVTVPVTLNHEIDTYWVGVIADVDGVLGQDSDQANNVSVAVDVLTVEGALGGCYEDDREDNDVFGSAVPLALGHHESLGSCGDADWYTLSAPALQTLTVDLRATPVLSVEETPADLVLELQTAEGVTVDRSDNDGLDEQVNVFNPPSAGTYLVRVSGRTPQVRAAYTLDVSLTPPSEGVDLLSYNVEASPRQSFPGGTINVAWRAVNVGTSDSGVHRVRVWASTDPVLDLGVDLLVAEQEGASVDGLAEGSGEAVVTLPNTLPGGDWYLLVQLDADDDVVEADETNNIAASAAVALDADLACLDDDLEPNDELLSASPIALSDGVATIAAAICPELDDWYWIELSAGQSIEAEVDYDYQANKGQVRLELWDTTGQAPLIEVVSSDSLRVQLPWVWQGGIYYLRVATQPQGGNEGPYDYDLDVTVAPGEPGDACETDAFEHNNGFETARPAGCGEQAATLCKMDVDYYTIDAVAGSTVMISVANGSSQTRTRVFTAVDESAVATRTGNGTLSYTPTEDGLLWIRVEPRSGPQSMSNYPYTLTIDGVSGVDLVIPTFESLFDVVIQGEDTLLDFEVANSCTLDAGPFDLRLWLSVDTQLDEGDIEIGGVAVEDGLLAGESLTFSEKVTVPESTLAGAYHFIAQVDAGDAVEESNESNNARALPVAVDARCVPDAFEPNDYLADLADIPSLVEPGATGLTACPFDVDWFVVQAPAGSTVRVDARFDHDEGDLDLRLYDATFSTTVPVATSSTADDDESIAWDVALETILLVRVGGFSGASAAYDLTLAID